MPSKETHLQIIANNYKTLLHLIDPNPEEYIDWSNTIIFYMSLHYIHAYFSLKQYHPTAHTNIQQEMNNDHNLKPLYEIYRNLQTESENARYNGIKTNIYDLRNESLKWFKAIQNTICKFLKDKNYQKIDLYPHFETN